MLKLENITLKIQNKVLFSELSLKIQAGQVTTLMGPSGCGKSSLLAYVCGTLTNAFSASGRIWINKIELTHLPTERRKMGILFQYALLVPHFSVEKNLSFALDADLKTQLKKDRINQALEGIELAGMNHRDPASLSGGQRARVALMRTLLAQPEALLLDEPFSKLDQDLRTRFRELVFSHAKQNRLPVLLVTHDPVDAEIAGGEIIRL